MAEEKDKKKVRRPSAQKRELQHEKRRIQNKAFKAKVNTAVKSFQQAATKGDASVKEKLSEVFSLMDKGVKTGVFTSNKVGRVKSRFTNLAKPKANAAS